MMNINRYTKKPLFTFEYGLYLLAFLIALALRFINVGAAPLSDAEASWALQALTVSGSNSSTSISLIVGPQPAYLMLTGILFSIFGSSNFLARFWPALAGSALALAPYLFSRPGRSQILGRKPALVLAFGLALTPGLVIASRTAGSPIMALAFSLIAIGLIINNSPIAAGVFLGLALLSGPSIIPGGLMLLSAWGACQWFKKRKSLELSENQALHTHPAALSTASDHSTSDPDQIVPPFSWKILIISAFFTILLVGSGFLRFPAGLAGWINTLPAYIQGWATPSGVSPFTVLAALFFYEPMAVIFGLVSAFVALRHQKYMLWAIAWLVTGFLLLLIYPERQVMDLIWIVVPLWVLTADFLADYLPERPLNQPAVILALAILIFAGLLWFTLAYTTRLPVDSVDNLERVSRWIIMIGIIALITLAVVLVSMGWSWATSRQGLVLGLVAALGLYSFSAMTGAAFNRVNQPQELWGVMPAPGASDLFMRTIQDLSNWQTGRPESIDVVSTIDAPSLRWLLREYPNASFISQIDPQALPSILITSQSEQTPRLVEKYRGQEFVWWNRPGWTGALPQDFIAWFTFRAAPILQDKVILWTRGDIFPGSASSVLPSITVQP